ncbi:VWA domain-containing protein [Corynebacterium diphtheriae]|uniref:SpaA isopeptide-forming pilin-related protein n=1 Tax=Corynebacterium diphtheriae TaxID=1717 RepID=UPI00095C7A1A|nr:SpaA isopeptide-forming pilin-related protein [Corynebacterium diphtheriae]OLN12541.1 fimbrial assembly protein [Corynebacterium diphtheriae]QBY10462.1 VWA domain-containing protein [Corynebacterium diphtheriae]RKW93056.1 VWA domain-containing protein [Corynebacterium diphtheriae]RLP11863.1 VWA domain-containing protein [Corynebacterium diphtheriae]RLP19538.1 VWA domain-containing protein [Corynebacterium diphtheriae]
MKTKFMGVAAALIAALALVFGVAAPGALPSLPVATAQAQDRSFTVTSQQRYEQKGTRFIPNYKIPADQLSGGTITLGAGTVVTLESSIGFYLAPNDADFTVYYTGTGGNWYETKATYKKVSVKKYEVTLPEITIGGAAEIEFKGVHRGPPNTVISAKFDVVGGTTQPEPDPDPELSPEPNLGTSVTPAAPTAVDPATAPSCVEKGYINIPDTKGVDYFIGSEPKPAGQHFYEGQKATVKVTAEPQNGYQFAAGAKTEWSFDFSGEVKDCSDSSEDPKPAAVEGRHFDAIGHEFAVEADPVDPTKPNAFTAKVTEESHMKYATVRIEADATFLDPQKYNLTLDQIEPGVTLQKRNVNIGNGFITMDVVPVKDGKPVDSAVVPKDAVFTFTNNLSQNKNLKVTLDVYGEKKGEPKPPDIISPPDGAQWVHGRVPNPPMPQRCGLRIAVVADLSTSLNYADSNGFTESKKAANALIDSLAGTPAELGIYNFAGGAPRNPDGSTHSQNPPYISLQSDDGVSRAKSIVSNWNGNGSTNWEAGLKQVAAGNYDVVYFITDGMPTYSSKAGQLGLGGEFVQESALNQAIDAANELKAAGTRVVPIMVNLTVGGTHAQRTTVTQDLVLKNVRFWERGTSISEPGLYFQFTNKYVDAASYVGDNTTANFEIAYKNGGFKVYERNSRGRNIEVTRDQSKWTYGPRGVKTMGEDISGTGDTIRVEQYSQLAAQMKQIGEELASRCNGVVKVKKRIVDENGNVLEDGAPGWEFTLSAGGQDIIDPGNGDRVRKSLKTTSSANEDRGTASWNIMSEKEQQLTLVETQQPGFNLYKRNDKNAVCTETRDGVTKPIEVTNDGEFSFKVKMSAKDKKLSSVSCVVDNYKQPETPPGKLTFKKAQYDGDKIVEIPGLGGATFKIYPSKGGQPDYSAGELYTIKPGQESIEVKTTGTFFLVETKAPKGLNLLAQPVEFQISVDEKTKKYKISAVSTSSGQIQVSGQGDKMILQVADTTAGKLPKTGGYGVGLVGLIGAALAGAGLLLGRRKTA